MPAPSSLHEPLVISFRERKGGAGNVLECDGVGYLPPRQADTGRMPADKPYALHEGMAVTNRGSEPSSALRPVPHLLLVLDGSLY